MQKRPMAKVFISYSHHDKATAERVRETLRKQKLDVWLDSDRVQAGESVTDAIKEGLESSDYFVLLVSESSQASNWVKREIAAALDLADAKKLSLVPVLIGSAPLPFEFGGLLYIDARSSLKDGLNQLTDFFKRQFSTFIELDKTSATTKSANSCTTKLKRCALTAIRREIAKQLSLNEMRVVWFDVFNTTLDNDVASPTVSTASVELIDRANRQSLLPELYDSICHNNPRVATALP